MSLICTVVLVLLCISEVGTYFTVETKSDMLVDISHREDRLDINIDILFPKIPCDMLTLDVQDVMGTHIVDVSGSLFKNRLDSKGVILS